MEKECYHCLIPHQDITYINNKNNFSIYAVSKDLKARAKVTEFAFDNVNCLYSVRYKNNFLKLKLVHGDKDNSVYTIPIVTLYKNDFLKISGGTSVDFRLKGEYNFKINNIDSKLKTKTHFETNDIFSQKRDFLFKTVTSFKYGVFGINMAAHMRYIENTKHLLIMPHLTIGNFTPSLYISPFDSKYGVCGSTTYKKYPFFFSLFHVPDGIEVNLGTKLSGEKNSLSMFITNATTLSTEAKIYFAEPLMVRAWMITPIFDTEKANIGAEINLDYTNL